MRILHLISSKGLFGAERVVIELSKGLSKVGNCRPIIGIIKNTYNPHLEMIDEANANKIEHVIFPCSRQFDFKTISQIREYITTCKIDIIHCHGYKSNFYGLLSSRREVPMITTNHNWLTAHWKLKIYCFLDSLWIRFFNRIVAVSVDIKKDMMKYKVPAEKISVVDNGIDLSRFDELDVSKVEIKGKLGIDGNDKIVGTVGSLGHEKGHAYLLRAAKEIVETDSAVKFIIVGDGPLRKDLENETDKLGIRSNVIFTGYRSDIPEVLSIFDIFVLPSLKEGLPMVILEAMASKKPVISSGVGAVPKVIKSGENGLLCEPGNANELTRSIVELLEDKERSLKLALNGYRTIAEGFSSVAMSSAYMQLYKELLRQAA